MTVQGRGSTASLKSVAGDAVWTESTGQPSVASCQEEESWRGTDKDAIIKQASGSKLNSLVPKMFCYSQQTEVQEWPRDLGDLGPPEGSQPSTDHLHVEGSAPLYSQSPLDPLSLQKDQVEIPKGIGRRPTVYIEGRIQKLL